MHRLLKDNAIVVLDFYKIDRDVILIHRNEDIKCVVGIVKVIITYLCLVSMETEKQLAKAVILLDLVKLKLVYA